MTRPPLVSILIPAFNAQEWIACSLESAIGQSWRHKEIIVVDDGSKDKTLAICRRFTSKTVQVVTQPNQGAAAARNKAYSICQGDYIQWLDADDLLAPDKIARQIEACDSRVGPRTLLSGAWGHFFYRVGRSRFQETALWRDLAPVEWLLVQMTNNVFMANSSWLVSRELAQAAGPWNTTLTADDDGEYFCRVILASDGIRFVPRARAFYRMPGPKNLSHIGVSDEKWLSQFRSIKSHIDYLRSAEDSPRVREASLAYLQDWMIRFYPERLDIVEQLRQIAASLGGTLTIPQLPRKYSWIEGLLGRAATKRIQLSYNEFKLFILRSWDKGMFRLGQLGVGETCANRLLF